LDFPGRKSKTPTLPDQRVGHPEKQSRLLGVDFLERYHPIVTVRQQKKCGRACHPPVLHQAGGSTIDGASYTLDSAGNRTAKTNQATAVASNYTYDAIYQLLSTAQGGSTTESDTYDPVGNRTASLGVSPYSNNASNELTAVPGTSYTYDSRNIRKKWAQVFFLDYFFTPASAS
jgi:hypothetical protein